MSDSEAWNQLHESLNALDGKECWDVRGGHAAGSAVSLHFGNRIKRSRESSRQQDPIGFEVGEYVVFGWGPWELRDGRNCVCTSQDSNPDESVAALKRAIVGSRVAAHELREREPQFLILFAPGLTLELRAGPQEAREIEFLDAAWAYSITHDGEIEVEERGEY